MQALEHDWKSVPLGLQQRDNKNGKKSTPAHFTSMSELGWFLLVESIKNESTKLRMEAQKKIPTLTRNASLAVLDLEAFWNAVHVGTRFPKETEFSTDAQHKNHMSTHETTPFWRNFNKDMSTISLFVQHVLQFLRLPSNCSRQLLFDSVFQECVSKSPCRNLSSNKLFPHGSGPWAEIIMSSLNENYQCVYVHVSPIVKEQKQTGGMKVRKAEGVKVIICVDVL